MGAARWVVVMGMALLLSAAAGCGDGGTDTVAASSTTMAAGSEDATSAFLVRAADEWTPLHALHPVTGPHPLEPSLDWSLDYERPPVDAPQRVRLSGHRIDVDGLVASLVGFSFDPVDVRGGRALAGRSSDPIGPSVVLLPLTERYTAMVLSYELGVADLVQWAGALTGATQAEWTAANEAEPVP